MAKRHRPHPITIRRADGTVKVVPAGEFARRKFSYSRYRQSKHWRAMRLKVLDREGYRCAHCRATAREKLLEVHHLTYERLGREVMEDLIALCQRCHATEHQWRKLRGV